MAPRRQRDLTSRTVVILEAADRKSLQQRAKADNISASEVMRRSLRAYTTNSAQQEEEDLRALFAEMNAALDSALESTRSARLEIRRNLDLIKERRKEHHGEPAGEQHGAAL